MGLKSPLTPSIEPMHQSLLNQEGLPYSLREKVVQPQGADQADIADFAWTPPDPSLSGSIGSPI